MSLKSIVKRYCPSPLLPALKIVARPYIYVNGLMSACRALKYLQYYQDELSREILRDRIEYLKTNDKNIFLKRAQKEGWTFTDIYSSNHRKYSGLLVIYDKKSNRLEYTRNFASMLNIKVRFMTLREFLKNGNPDDSELLVIIVHDWHLNLCKNRVKDYLSAHNMHCDVSTALASIREEEQYLDVFAPSDDEIVVDAGCYDGATAMRFLKWGGDKIRHIYSFEFDPVNAVKCEENLKPYGDKVTLIQKGTWDKEGTVYTSAGGGVGSRVTSGGSTEIQLASIDSELSGVPVTFIKMDVEGAELKSLIGAKNTIIKNHPRLAICVYHEQEDIYEIPAYILSLVPEYKFYLRHYSTNQWETVLYAYCE